MLALDTRRPTGFAALLAAVLCALPAAGQDARQERKIERAERRFAKALEARDEAYEELLAEYRAAEAWLTSGAEPAPPPPDVVRRWLLERAVPPERFGVERVRLAEDRPFHEWWNEELFQLSKPARRYSQTARALEKSFHALERLRHPERYDRGFERTPAGMALIPAGTYVLGPSTGYLLGHPKVQEERQDRLSAFYLDRREVSCAEYARFLLAQPPSLRDEHLPSNWSWSEDGSPLFPDGWASYPVVGVTWASAASYAEWIGKRLPTEEEWEAAAGGFSRRRYPMGNRFDVGKVNCRAFGAGSPRSPQEFSEDSTPQGIQSMTGNVREWTSDLYEEPPGKDVAKQVDRAGAETMAVVRGGSFQDDPESCTTVYRWLYPALDTRLDFVGFRCAKDVR